MPNLDPWINQNEEHITTNKFAFFKIERQKMIHPNSHPTYNERQQKIIDMIDGVLEKYTAPVNTKKNQQNEQVIINNIIEELDKKREIAINKKKEDLLKDEVLKY